MWSEGSRMHYCCPDLRLGCRHGRLVCGRMYTPVNGKGIFLYTSFGVPDEEWCWWLRNIILVEWLRVHWALSSRSLKCRCMPGNWIVHLQKLALKFDCKG